MSRDKTNRREFLGKAVATIAATRLGSYLSLPMLREQGSSLQSGGAAQSGAVKTNGKIFGLMVDAGRLPESMSYYRRLVDFCVDWGLNAIQFGLADDQGCALRFKSHPDLLTHNNAFTPDQMRRLADYAQHRGVELIPILESFGHTGYITRSPKYADLRDQDPEGKRNFIAGVVPVDPRTLEIFEDLYHELASIFPSKYLHGACDEVIWGGSELSRKALLEKSSAEIWADYLNSLNRICEGLQKEFIVWGDFVLHHEPEILKLLQKDIIVMDWNYWDDDPSIFRRSAMTALENGSRVIGGPAWGWSRWGPRAGTQQLRNIDAWADVYSEISDPRCMGLILTNWFPSRYIQDAIWDGFAYAAIAFTKGSAQARTSAFRLFVEEHWGAQWNHTWEKVFRTSYEIAPGRVGGGIPTSSWKLPAILPVPWSTEEELTAAMNAQTSSASQFTELRSLLILCEPLVRKNLDDFKAFQLTFRYIERLFLRNAILAETAKKKPATKDSATQLIKLIATQDHELLVELDRAWDRGRPADSYAKFGHLEGERPGDQLLFEFRRASTFSAQLAEDPDSFYAILTAASPGADTGVSSLESECRKSFV